MRLARRFGVARSTLLFAWLVVLRARALRGWVVLAAGFGARFDLSDRPIRLARPFGPSVWPVRLGYTFGQKRGIAVGVNLYVFIGCRTRGAGVVRWAQGAKFLS